MISSTVRANSGDRRVVASDGGRSVAQAWCQRLTTKIAGWRAYEAVSRTNSTVVLVPASVPNGAGLLRSERL
jgi:hypothetical protein